jgi:hypothetical protein
MKTLTIGDVTGTLFVDGAPTGTEILIFNESGISRAELLALLNGPELLEALRVAEDALSWYATERHLVATEALAAVRGALSLLNPEKKP